MTLDVLHMPYDLGLTTYLTTTMLLLLAGLGVIFVVLFFVLAIDAHKMPIVAGREAIIHEEGVVIYSYPTITVRVLGELWEARSKHLLKPGDLVKVTAIHGLVLTVVPKKE